VKCLGHAVVVHVSRSRRHYERQSLLIDLQTLAKAQLEGDQHKGAHMTFWDWYTGTKRPAAGLPAKSAADVKADLLAVNNPTLPFLVRDGAPESVDLVAEWRIVDAEWYEIFAKAGLKKTFKVLMKLDDQAKEVRSIDEERSVEWHAGVPTLSLKKTFSRGQSWHVSRGTVYGITKQGTFGEIYRYNFSTSEIKSPLQDAAIKAGWIWRGVAFGVL
jgi:hypothetical protein